MFVVFFFFFSKNVVFCLHCSSPMRSFWISRLSIERIDFCPRQGVLILESLSLFSDACSEKRICLGQRMSGNQSRFPAHRSWWRVMAVSSLSIFVRWTTTLLAIRFCHLFREILQSFIWGNFSGLRMSLWYSKRGFTGVQESRYYNRSVVHEHGALC